MIDSAVTARMPMMIEPCTAVFQRHDQEKAEDGQ
jgi:hypothetical protein